MFGARIPVLSRGYFGVEFFFIVSGFLMAKSIYKKRKLVNNGWDVEIDLGRRTIRFMLKKYLSVFCYHIIPFIMIVVLKVFTEDIYQSGAGGIIKFFIDSMPEFFFLQKFGFTFSNVDVIEWYISAMLIAMLALYPIVYRFYSMFTRVIGPFLSLYILGVLHYNYGTFADNTRWVGFGYACVFRAIAEISLGCSAYEFARILSEKHFTKRDRVFFTVMEIFGFSVSVMFALSSFSTDYEMHTVIVMTISIIFAFSGQTFGNEIFNKKWIYYLGRMSLEIYLCQLFGLNLVDNLMGGLPMGVKPVVTLAITFALAFALKPVGDRILSSLIDKKMAIKYTK